VPVALQRQLVLIQGYGLAVNLCKYCRCGHSLLVKKAATVRSIIWTNKATTETIKFLIGDFCTCVLWLRWLCQHKWTTDMWIVSLLQVWFRENAFDRNVNPKNTDHEFCATEKWDRSFIFSLDFFNFSFCWMLKWTDETKKDESISFWIEYLYQLCWMKENDRDAYFWH